MCIVLPLSEQELIDRLTSRMGEQYRSFSRRRGRARTRGFASAVDEIRSEHYQPFG